VRAFVSTDFKELYKVRVVKEFPIEDRSTNVNPIKWYPRSVPDLLEDPHRGKAVVKNSAMEIVREQTKPIYLAKEGSVRLDMLENAEAGDIVEVKGSPDDIRPMTKTSIQSEVNWVLDILDASAQEATATPDIQQGVMMDQQRTASELNLVASGSKNRYGIVARIFGSSLRRFWEIWYNAIQENWDERVTNKTIKIAGVF